MKRLIGPTVLLIILLGALYALFTYTNVRAPFSSHEEAKGVQISNQQVRETGDSYSINVQYPQFGIPEADTQIKSDIDAAVAEVKGYPAIPADSAAGKNTLDGSFDKVYVGQDVLSVELLLSVYTGGAHGNTAVLGLNFDRSTGKLLTLDDALKMTGLTLDQVSEKTTTYLRKKLGDGFFAEGAKPTSENFAVFTTSANAVTFIFSPYQVAPYAAGIQEVSFERRQ